MYDQTTMNPSLYSQFMGGGGTYGNMPMTSPQVQQGMGNPMDMSQMSMGAQMPSTPAQQPMQDPMAQYMEQQRRQKAMQMMGQGIANMGRNQMAMPSGNTAQIIRDQGGPRMQGNQQQMMAQALRNRGQ